jgi:tetratricopeptide (TPR) repeat protein
MTRLCKRWGCMMNICLKCNAPYEPEDRYCGHCGERLPPSAAEEKGLTQKALSLSDVRYKLGMVYYQKGQYTQAVEIWQKLLEDHPDTPSVQSLIEQAEARSRGVSS